MTSDTSIRHLNHDLLKQVFVHHLNRLYFGKCYLNSHITAMINMASFNGLKLGLQEFGDDLKKQIMRMHEVYKFVDEVPSDANCNPLKSIVRDNFCLEDTQDLDVLRDTDIILYVQMLEHMNITACRMLQLLCSALNYEDAGQLLTECFDESVDNDHLFHLISKEYIKAD